MAFPNLAIVIQKGSKGFLYYGPFESEEHAQEWCNAKMVLGEDIWWIDTMVDIRPLRAKGWRDAERRMDRSKKK